MTKLRTDPVEKARADFMREIKVKRAQFNILQRDIGVELGLTPGTTSSLLSRPDSISVGRLRKIIAMLHLDPLVVLALLGYSVKEVRKAFAESHGT